MSPILEPGTTFEHKGSVVKVIRFLDKGKGGYSYLVQYNGGLAVLKVFHHEPCSVYVFKEDKLALEMRDYAKLKEMKLPIPELYERNDQEEYIIKEYINGPTVAELIAKGPLPFRYFLQMDKIIRIVYSYNRNIDYMPQNFVIRDEKLIYVDYERNVYSKQWDFAHWGIYFWVNSKGMKKYLETRDHAYLSKKGIPLRTFGSFIHAKVIIAMLYCARFLEAILQHTNNSY